MTASTNLRYLQQGEIDTEKWDLCIDTANNCRFYAYTGQLDRATSSWDALIMGDYEFVMPLPIRKKYGIKYLYQPLYSQQLGIFPTPRQEISNAFYSWLYRHFRFAEFNLNAGNLPGEKKDHLQFTACQNYLLPLGNDYATISSFFSKNTRRNIAKAEKNELSVVEGINLETFLDFKLKNSMTPLNKPTVNTLKSMIAFGQYKGFGKVYGVYTSENQLCSAVYFCGWKDRVIYFNAVNSEAGKERGGMYFLLNHFIKQQAGKFLTLDFEGSMIPGVARFYKGFGATPETYFRLKINRLPLPLKWFKK